MKKLFLALCVTVCLLFSVAVIPVRADDRNGHNAGYVCVESETVDCPLDGSAPQQQSETSGSKSEESEEDTSLTLLLELVITLILKS